MRVKNEKMSHEQNSIKKYFQATRSPSYHPQMPMNSMNPGQNDVYNNMNCVRSYAEQQNNSWSRNAPELITFNDAAKNPGYNANSYDFYGYRDYGYINNFTPERSHLENNPRMMAHPYVDYRKFESHNQRNFQREREFVQTPPFSNITNIAPMTSTIQNRKPMINYEQSPPNEELKIVKEKTPTVPKYEEIQEKQMAQPITVIESPRAGVITTTTTKKQPTTPDKPKNLLTTGMRVFTGSVDKAMKWYSIFQEIGVDHVLEVIARCISVKPGNGCEKHVLVRDSSGPVLQVIYYEIDFLLPEMTTGTSVRIIGKMIGKNRMKAFRVRKVLPFEEAALPRMSAISHHMINKLHASYIASHPK